MKTIQIVKRDGSLEALDVNKIHKKLQRAFNGLPGVSVSDVEINSNLQFHDKMKSSDIDAVLVRSAVDLMSEENPNYQFRFSKTYRRKFT